MNHQISCTWNLDQAKKLKKLHFSHLIQPKEDLHERIFLTNKVDLPHIHNLLVIQEEQHSIQLYQSQWAAPSQSNSYKMQRHWLNSYNTQIWIQSFDSLPWYHFRCDLGIQPYFEWASDAVYRVLIYPMEWLHTHCFRLWSDSQKSLLGHKCLQLLLIHRTNQEP